MAIASREVTLMATVEDADDSTTFHEATTVDGIHSINSEDREQHSIITNDKEMASDSTCSTTFQSEDKEQHSSYHDR